MRLVDKRSRPEGGDSRTKKGFLFLPKRIGNETRWLEFATWKQFCYWELNGEFYKWVDYKWVDVNK